MEFIRGKHNIRAGHYGCVATIGNFDGVHLGHQSVAGQLLAAAHRYGTTSTAIVFEPQPVEFFLKTEAPARLTRWREKLEALCALGLERVLCLRFDRELARIPAEGFVHDLLVRKLGVRAVVIGDDFRFGRDRQGDYQLLERLGSELGFAVERTRSFNLDNERVSSTLIRKTLEAGDLRKGASLLGRPFGFTGHVVHGQQRGRTMGFPTANIRLGRQRSPVHGIFAAQVSGLNDKLFDAVAYVGDRPIVGDGQEILEVHIFDFHADCYGRLLHVSLVEKIRDDLPFTSFDDLRMQITVDVAEAKRILKNNRKDWSHEDPH